MFNKYVFIYKLQITKSEDNLSKYWKWHDSSKKDDKHNIA